MRKLIRIAELLKHEGLRRASSEVLHWILKFRTPDRKLQRLKARLSREISASMNSKVQAGPFQSMLFVNEGWGSPEYVGMLLGSYEIEVQQVLEYLGKSSESFVDVGAASGYYVVGMLLKFPHIRAIAYETSKSSAAICLKNSKLNSVDDRLEIRSIFRGDLMPEISNKKGLFLFDIEGAEYNLITLDFILEQLNSHFVVELHGRNTVLINDFVGKFVQTHNTKIIGRDYNKIMQNLVSLKLAQNLTFLLASEGRDVDGSWLLACPKNAEYCECTSTS